MNTTDNIAQNQNLLVVTRGDRRQVLGSGSVTILDWMGNDADIVAAARKSYGKSDDKYTDAEAEKLIRYMVRHKHTSPFEMAELKFNIVVPMDIWRQIVRHRTASVNEHSTRYTMALTKLPLDTPFRMQSRDNKQGSSENMREDIDYDFHLLEGEQVQRSRTLYSNAVREGMSLEQARRFLPLSTMTEAVWKMDLHNLMHFLNLRMDPSAQFEVRKYALAIAYFVSRLFPITYQAYCDYVFNGLTFSVQEQALLGAAIRGVDLTGPQSEMSTRELKELEDKLKMLNHRYKEWV